MVLVISEYVSRNDHSSVALNEALGNKARFCPPNKSTVEKSVAWSERAGALSNKEERVSHNKEAQIKNKKSKLEERTLELFLALAS